MDRPGGVNIEVSYNAIFGDADVTSTQPRLGITTANGEQGSRSTTISSRAPATQRPEHERP